MRRKQIVLRLAAAAALVLAASALPPTAASAAPDNNAVYLLANGSSGKCLQVSGASTANAALLVQIACNNAATDQQFRTVAQGAGFGLVNVNSGRCADVPSGSGTSGLQLQQWGCAGSTNQTFTFSASTAASGKFLVRSVASGLCVSNRDGSTAGGNPIVQEACSDISRTQWQLRTISGGGRTWSNTADGFAAGTTGGAGGTTVTVTNFADLVRYATAATPHVIRISGTITYPTYGQEIRVTSNKTLIGLGTNAELVHGGIYLAPGVRNVIIRNLTIRDTRMADDDPDDKVYDYDGIQMDTADHIWIDHNRIMRMNDGIIDSRMDTTNLTVSWNVLAEGNKAFGIGWTTNVTARMTIHHNWIHHTGPRNPSTDNVAYAHLYNNYLQSITGYGNYSRGATKMVIENSYFEGVRDPFYPDSTAQLRQTGSILVNCTGKQQTLGSAFTPSSFYSYTLDPAANVPSLLRTYTGPQANISM